MVYVFPMDGWTCRYKHRLVVVESIRRWLVSPRPALSKCPVTRWQGGTAGEIISITEPLKSLDATYCAIGKDRGPDDLETALVSHIRPFLIQRAHPPMPQVINNMVCSETRPKSFDSFCSCSFSPDSSKEISLSPESGNIAPYWQRKLGQ